MQITVAKRAGFCFGVKRAIDIAFKLAANEKDGVYTLGPIIHNPQVVSELINKGVSPTGNVRLPDIKTLIIRTHGIAPKINDEILKIGYKVVDATCPFVKKAQKHAKTLSKEGYQIIILGDKKHPEVKALLGFAGDDVMVLNSKDPIPRLKNKVGIIVQTTQPLEALENILCKVARSAREIKVYNTICDSTAMRLKETRELAGSVDLMIIAGGKNSANTAQLTNLSKEICAKVYHIETAGELKKGWFKGVKKVGITGGASTPQWIIDGVVKKLREISGGK